MALTLAHFIVLIQKNVKKAPTETKTKTMIIMFRTNKIQRANIIFIEIILFFIRLKYKMEIFFCQLARVNSSSVYFQNVLLLSLENIEIMHAGMQTV